MLSQVFLHFYYVEILLFRFQLLCFSPLTKLFYLKRLGLHIKKDWVTHS